MEGTGTQAPFLFVTNYLGATSESFCPQGLLDCEGSDLINEIIPLWVYTVCYWRWREGGGEAYPEDRGLWGTHLV